jgi:hypothetical protein
MSSCDLPRCEACLYSKQKRRTSTTDVKKRTIPAEGGLSNNILQPGQRVSVNLYQSSTLGRLPHTKGKEADDEKYCGGATFYDIASKLIFVRHQSNLTCAETVVSKHSFERFSDELGVTIKEYLSDNHAPTPERCCFCLWLMQSWTRP